MEAWTPIEYAEAMGLTRNTVYHLLKHGEIPGAIRLGRQWRIVKAAFLASLTSEEQESSEAK